MKDTTNPKEDEMKKTNPLRLLTYLALTVMIFNVALFARWSETREREFTLRNTNGTTGVNIYGDFNVTGAPVMCVKGNGNTCNWTYGGNLYTAEGLYLTDFNTNQIALNSSSADLTIPADAIITKAYLYWNGHIHGTNPANYATAIAGYNSVVLKTPDGTNHTVTANINDTTKVNFHAFINDGAGDQGFRHFYQATADVTDIVKNGGFDPVTAKSFTVGNLKTTSGLDSWIGDALFNWGSIKYGPMGGWSLVVEYNRPVASGQAYKNVAIYDGFKVLIPTTLQTTKSVDINLSGFFTPLTGPVKSSMAYFMMGAEKSLAYESAKIAKKNGTLQSLFNTLNPVDNVFNDTVSIYGVHLNTTRQYNPGLDLDVFNLANSCKDASNNTVACIETSQSSTRIQLTSKFVPAENNGDQSFSGMVAFSTDIYSPDISTFRKDSNTTSTQQLNPGDSVGYTLDFNNSGTEAAENITIYDTFSSTVGGDMLLDIIDRNSTALKNGIRLKSISEANYHCAIGSTDPACASLLKDANCSVDYANNDILKATKVWCNIPYMAVGARYLMQFTAKVRDDYNQSSAEANVTNVAYSDYYNAATHEYVSIVGQSNINTAGVVGGYVPIPATGFDAREMSISMADNNRSITTKIVNKPFQLNILSLDSAGAIAPYPIKLETRVYLYPVDSSVCLLSDSQKLAAIVPLPNTTYVDFGLNDTNRSSPAVNLSNALMNSVAGQDRRIAMNYVNWKDYESDFSAVHCSVSNTGGSTLQGVPQCMEASGGMCSKYSKNTSNIECIFGPEVALACAGSNSDGESKPGNLPCNGSSYNASNLPDSPYDNEYGCYQCLAQAIGKVTCSTDNFAARPDRLNVTSTDYDYPNLFRSAQDYNTTVHAYVYGANTDSPDYNVTSANMVFDINTTKYNRNDMIDAAMAGTASFSGDFNMSNGLSAKSGIIGSEVVGLKFDDVGKIDIHLEDQTWSAVDNDDTLKNCDSDGTYVCGDTNLTFIPHHFDFNTLTITNNNGNPGSFTYLANELGQMAGRIETQMRALNKDGNVVQNFAVNPLWENNIIVTPVVRKSTYIHPDANETTIANIAVGFGTGTDANGTKTIAWNDTNTSTYLRFNFQRDVNLAANPFDVNGSDLNISIVSNYTDASNAHTADINGSRLGTGVEDLPYTVVSPGNGKSTFVYGRIIPRDVRAFGDTVNVIASAWYEVYNSSSINGTSLPASRNEPQWFINTLHDDVGTMDGDGNVTQWQAGSNPSVALAPPIGNASAAGVETYNFGILAIGGYKAHIDTDPWLWYGLNALGYADPVTGNTETDCNTHPCFNISVVPAIGATGSAKSTNEATKSSKKTDTGGGTWNSTSDYAPAIR
jgi:uncharacterized repeat protein (TIGR01451 family)